MREALHRCDPPCIPYLGMYLTDLSFIEEGTPDFTPDGLLNFSKMRMVSKVLKTNNKSSRDAFTDSTCDSRDPPLPTNSLQN